MPSIIRRIKRKITRKINKVDFAGRNITVFDNDIFIASYPKSGNTWIRFLVANLIHPEQDINFSNIDRKIPDIYQKTNQYLLNLPKPRIIKSHEYFDPRYQKVFYIVRDPRDVLVSNYYHYLKYSWDEQPKSMEEFSQDFISGSYEMFGDANRFGSWKDNVGSWLGAKDGDANFMLIRYEDLEQNKEDNAARIARFFNANDSLSNVRQAIKNSSVKRMRNLEKKEADVWPTRQSQRKNISFVRAAKSGNWSEELSSSIVNQISQEWGDLMKSLGYEL
ncbi:MAG: sulfotransferase domain-containing protein [Pleurocapsa sp.]